MEASGVWFAAMAALSLGALVAGHRIGPARIEVVRPSVLLALLAVTVWAWLIRRPEVAVQVLPVSVLSNIEGIGALPAFMFIAGVAWSRGRRPRQRRVAVLAAGVGGVFFIAGGMWMILPTPQTGFATTLGEPVLQSQDYSCVPAASATALNMIGVPTSEAEMAHLSRTRPGAGSTMLRAMDGLRRRVADEEGRVDIHLVDAAYDELARLPMPALTALRYHPTIHHMVVITHLEGPVIHLHDPEVGRMWLGRDDFERYYGGRVLIFER